MKIDKLLFRSSSVQYGPYEQIVEGPAKGFRPFQTKLCNGVRLLPPQPFYYNKCQNEFYRPQRRDRKYRNGKVVSDKSNKTIVVEVSRRFVHPKYKKVMTTYKKYHAHDEKNKSKIGDMVSIAESKPISKLKRWTVVGGDK